MTNGQRNTLTNPPDIANCVYGWVLVQVRHGVIPCTHCVVGKCITYDTESFFGLYLVILSNQNTPLYMVIEGHSY